MDNGDESEELGLNFSVVDRDSCRVLYLRGELDVAMCGAQEIEFTESVTEAPGGLAVIDLSGVSFCDSIGMRILVQAARRLRAAGGMLRLATPLPWVKKLLTLTGVTQAIPVFDSLEAACAAPRR